MVAVEVAASGEEDAVGAVGEARRGWQLVKHAVEVGRVESKRESPPPLDVEVGAHRVLDGGSHGSQQSRRVLVAHQRRLGAPGHLLQPGEEGCLIESGRRVEASEEEVGQGERKAVLLGPIESVVHVVA